MKEALQETVTYLFHPVILMISSWLLLIGLYTNTNSLMGTIHLYVWLSFGFTLFAVFVHLNWREDIRLYLFCIGGITISIYEIYLYLRILI